MWVVRFRKKSKKVDLRRNRFRHFRFFGRPVPSSRLALTPTRGMKRPFFLSFFLSFARSCSDRDPFTRKLRYYKLLAGESWEGVFEPLRLRERERERERDEGTSPICQSVCECYWERKRAIAGRERFGCEGLLKYCLCMCESVILKNGDQYCLRVCLCVRERKNVCV